MKKVLVTRALEQADEFAHLLKDYGFEPVIFPVISFEPPADSSAVNKSIRDIGLYEWLIFTSANGVKFFMDALSKSGGTVNDIAKIKICAVGPKTAEAAIKFGLDISLIPENYNASGVLASFESINIKRKTVLFPRAETGNDILPEGLKKMGARIDMVPFYRTAKPALRGNELKKILHNGIDVVTFTSGSTVDNLLSILGSRHLDKLKGIKIACISELTAAVAERHGLGCDIIARKNRVDSLVDAIKEYYL